MIKSSEQGLQCKLLLALDFQLRRVNAHYYPTSTGIELTNSNKNPTMLSDHDKQQLIDQVDAINWYHSIDLGNGVVTKGIDNSANKLSRLKFPESFDGLSVLDIGAWDGFHLKRNVGCFSSVIHR